MKFAVSMSGTLGHMAFWGGARGAIGSRKDAKTQRKPVIVVSCRVASGMRWERNAVGVSVNCVGSSCAVLLRADWWVSRSVDYRGLCDGGFWVVGVV